MSIAQKLGILQVSFFFFFFFFGVVQVVILAIPDLKLL